MELAIGHAVRRMGMVTVIRKVKIFRVNSWKCFKTNLITKYFFFVVEDIT